jgi:ASC-1-like (ASCH) protein
MNYELKIQEKYFNLIKQGKKIYEGRLGNKQSEISKGMLIDFINNNTKERLTKKVVLVEQFPNFEAMLENRVESFLPGYSSPEEGVAIYHSIPGYQEKVEKFGALAIQLEEPRFYFFPLIVFALSIIFFIFFYLYKAKNKQND